MSIDVTTRPKGPGAKPAARDSADGDDAMGTNVPRRTKIVVLVGLVLFAVYAVAPVWWLVVSATKDERGLISGGGLWFGELHLVDNLRQINEYQGGLFWRWGLNSLLYAGVGSAVGTLVALAAGYGLSRFSYRGRGLSMALVIGSFLIPYAMLTLPLYLLFVQIGLVDTVWAVLLPTFISPFSVYLAKVYIDGAIPMELLEAARVDGAGEFRIFVQIVLKMLGTCGATVFLLSFVQSWNGFFLPLTMLQGAENWTLNLGLYNWLVQSLSSAAGTTDFTAIVITGALLSVIPLAVFLVAMQRFWRSGVSLGALK